MMFQDRLYRLRRERGLSQEELAGALGVSRQAVQKWESGVSQPTLEKLTALARYFGVTLDWLVNGEEAPAAPAQTEQGTPTIINNYYTSRGYWDWRYEYKSKAAIFGLPLVHINLQAAGFCRAKGVIAIGNVATGLITVGGFSLGLVSLGGLSVGLLALGGVAAGLVGLGGLAIGGLAVGGVAIGAYSIGGAAIGGKLAIGGAAVAPVAVGGAADGAKAFVTNGSADPAALEAAVREACRGLPHWFGNLMTKLALGR